MASPFVAAIASLTAFSSGFSGVIDAALPPGFSSFGEITGHITSPMPQGAQRVSDPGRMKELLSGRLQATSQHQVNFGTAGTPSATGAQPINGFDGCNGFDGQLVVTDQGALAFGNVNRQLRECATPADEEFWDVFAAQAIMFVAPNNVIYLTNGVNGIAFRKVA